MVSVLLGIDLSLTQTKGRLTGLKIVNRFFLGILDTVNRAGLTGRGYTGGVTRANQHTPHLSYPRIDPVATGIL